MSFGARQIEEYTWNTVDTYARFDREYGVTVSEPFDMWLARWIEKHKELLKTAMVGNYRVTVDNTTYLFQIEIKQGFDFETIRLLYA